MKPWTTKEVGYLAASYGKVPVGEIAAHLNRTERAVYRVAQKHGIHVRKTEPRSYARWSDTETEILSRMVSDGFTSREIARLLKRGESAVDWRRRELKQGFHQRQPH